MAIERGQTVDHDEGEAFTCLCLSCETEEMGDIEHCTEGVCWRCRKCGGAQDLSVVVSDPSIM